MDCSADDLQISNLCACECKPQNVRIINILVYEVQKYIESTVLFEKRWWKGGDISTFKSNEQEKSPNNFSN